MSPTGDYGQVFPTGVGMFLRACRSVIGEVSLPHGRGDVSPLKSGRVRYFSSSPRAWGCFSDSTIGQRTNWVFPTGVGMFLAPRQRVARKSGLPHGRGDVSRTASEDSATLRSSPRAWGCFPFSCTAGQNRVVFPTGVGMFPGTHNAEN